MTEIDQKAIEARLRERAGEIAGRRRAIHSAQEGMREGELADYDQHPADTGTEMHEQELDETTDMILADEAEQVELALRRLAEGKYGICVDCGREIPRERLEAVAEAIRCIDDQRRYEGMLRERTPGPPPQFE